MKCHEVDYQVIGDDLQMVEVELDPGESVIAEAGVMNYMEDGITYEARLGDGSRPQQGFMDTLISAGKRMLTGESMFLTHFRNEAPDKRKVAFAAPYPGKILPLDLGQLGGEVILQKDAFIAAALGTENCPSPSRRSWESGSLGGRASSCSACGAMAWSSATPAGPSSPGSCGERVCAWTRDAWWASLPGSSTTSRWSKA